MGFGRTRSSARCRCLHIESLVECTGSMQCTGPALRHPYRMRVCPADRCVAFIDQPGCGGVESEPLQSDTRLFRRSVRYQAKREVDHGLDRQGSSRITTHRKKL